MLEPIAAFAASEKAQGWWRGSREHADNVRHQNVVRKLAVELDAGDVAAAIAELDERMTTGWKMIDAAEARGEAGASQQFTAHWLKLERVYEAHCDVARHQAMRERYGLPERGLPDEAPAPQPTASQRALW